MRIERFPVAVSRVRVRVRVSTITITRVSAEQYKHCQGVFLDHKLYSQRVQFGGSVRNFFAT